jgi:hypothetical protein
LRALAGLLGVFGLLIALVPEYVLPVCGTSLETKAGTLVPMRCFWTARAELGVGALIVLAGILLFLSRNRSTTLSLHAMVSGLGLVTVLVPTVLIGVCAGPTMPCHEGTLPALVMLGCLVMVAGLAGIILSARGESQAVSWATD